MANFIPPTSELPSVSETQLQSTNQFSNLVFGNPIVIEGTRKINHTCLQLNGTTDYLVITDPMLSKNVFTVDLWVWFNFIDNTEQCIVSQSSGSGVGSTSLSVKNQKLTIINNLQEIVGITTISAKTWHHIAFTRNILSIKAYLNGYLEASGDSFVEPDRIATQIGSRAGSNLLFGRLDAVRFRSEESWTGTFTPPTRSTYIADEYFDDVVLLIRGDSFTAPTDPYADRVALQLGMDHYTNSTYMGPWEDSNNALGITFVGNAKIISNHFKHNYPAIAFDGINDAIVVDNSANIALGDTFTFEFWVYIPSFSIKRTLFDKRESTDLSGMLIYLDTDTKIYSKFGDSTSGWDVELTSSTLSIGWHHVVIVRNASDSNSWKLFVDGTQHGSTLNSSITIAENSDLVIGRNRDSAEYFNGLLSEIQLTQSAKYTTSVAVPTVPVPKPINVEYDQTSLLLHFDGTDGTTEFVDSSRWGHSVVGSFGAKISTTQSKFGSSSLYLNGTTGCGVIVHPHDSFNLGEGDFTIECWVRVDSIGTARAFMNMWVQNGAAYGPFFTLQMNASNRFIFLWMPYSESSSALSGSAVTIAANTWYHVAVTRCHDWWTLWVNGAIDAQATLNPRNFRTSLKFRPERWKSYGITLGDYFDGTKYGTTTSEWIGYIDEVRIVKGKAMFTVPFTPPTSAYSLSSNYPYRDTNVKLFLDTTKDYYIKDESIGVNAISLEGGLTAGKAIGGSYASFDGTGDAIRISSAGDTAFAADDFTVEAWVYPINGGWVAQNWGRIIETEQYGTAGGFLMVMNNSGTTSPCSVRFDDSRTGGTEFTINTVAALPNSTWSHVAFTKEGNYLSSWLNGVLKSRLLLDGIMSKLLSNSLYLFTNMLKTAYAAPSSAWSTAISQESFDSQSSTGVYFEVLVSSAATSNNQMVGVVTTSFDATTAAVHPGTRATGWGYNGFNGNKYNSNNSGVYGSTYTTGDVIGVAVKNGKIWFAKNNTWQASGNPVTEANPAYSNLTGNVRIAVGVYTTCTLVIRGKTPEFSYTPPTGFTTFNAVAPFAYPILEKTKVSIGANNSSAESFYGYIDDVRLTRSISRYSMLWTEKTLSGDASSANVTLLLNCNGTNGETTFTDSSNSNKTVSPSNTTTVTGTKRFGSASALFNGTSSYLSVDDSSDWNYGTGDFTIEMWCKFAFIPSDIYSASGAQCLYNQTLDANNLIALIATKTGFTFLTVVSGSQTVLLSVTSAHDYDWHHIAITRSGTTFTIWVDSLSKGTTTSSATLPDLAATIEFGRAGGGGRYFSGWLDDIRLTKGVCRYPSEFSYPQTPPGLVPIPQRKIYDLPSNVTSPSSIRSLRGESAKFDIATDLVYPGTTALPAESVANWVVMPYNYSMVSDTMNFTLEGWFNPQSPLAGGWVFTKDVNTSDGFLVGVSKITIYFRGNGSVDLIKSGLSLTGWNHVVFQKNMNLKQIYLNGVKVAEQSTTITSDGRDDTICIGAPTSISAGNRYMGYIDGLRFTRGVARYNEDFTPPTIQFPPKFNSFANTDLMLFFTDPKSYPDNVRVAGDPELIRPSGVTEKGSCWFDGDDDWIQLPTGSTLSTENFTLEFWFEAHQTGSVASPIYIWTQGLSLTQVDRVGIVLVGNSIQWFFGTTYVTLDQLNLYTWTHIAITRDSGWVSIFVNRIS